MIVGIGCDLTEIYRVKKALTIEKFAARVFSPAEQEYCEARGMQKFASYAARFAAKEALLKALGTGLRGGKLIDIEVYETLKVVTMVYGGLVYYPSRMFYKLALHSSKSRSISALLCTRLFNSSFMSNWHLSILEDNTPKRNFVFILFSLYICCNW